VETGVNKLIATLGDPAFKVKAKDAQIAQIGEEISAIFDFTELSNGNFPACKGCLKHVKILPSGT
jgi:hypothetical protein